MDLKIQEVPRLLLRIDEAATALGVGRSKMFQIVAKGAIPTIKVDGIRRIPVEALKKWIEDQQP